MDRKVIGINNHTYATEQGDPAVVGVGSTQVTTVLVEGANNDYAAYEGVGSEQFIAARGQKIHFDDAKIFFPWIETARYRR